MKNYKKILEAVKKEVKKRLKSESAHDYWHCYRVVQTAKYIGRKEKADLVVLEFAAWLHDIAHPVSKMDHDIEGAKLAKKFLTAHRVDKQLVEKIVSCIRKHRFIKGKKANSLEEKILQDADKLDALGAVGIVRVFTVAGEHGQTIHNPKVKSDFSYYLKNDLSKTTIAHFYDKLFKLKKLMHTETAKKIAEKREKYMKDFLKKFYKEWEGKL